MPVTIKSGDLLRQDGIDAIVNTVNCVGVMGKGIALQFKQKWPENYTAYEAACRRGEVKIGKMFVFDSGGLVQPNFIINFPTKKHWRGKSKIEFIQEGLLDLIRVVNQFGIRSIAVPPLGCGNGGLAWSDVRPLIEGAFAQVPNVQVYLFQPQGAPSPREIETRTQKPRMTPGRASILKLLEVYRELDYGLSKIEIQKLAYFLQCAGIDLKLRFQKHSFGPYSQELRHALQHMEGHYIVGVGDGSTEADIAPVPGGIDEADRFLVDSGNEEIAARVTKVSDLIEGFQSPYGMELLATVHWVATNQPGAQTVGKAIEAVQEWNDRKRQIMSPDHITIAWERLTSQGWIPCPS